jgi:hypothetical protein
VASSVDLYCSRTFTGVFMQHRYVMKMTCRAPVGQEIFEEDLLFTLMATAVLT